MAGTPTTNYNIPTYADTDAPDLSGAYNDAMGIIDTQLKANADAITTASKEYTGENGVAVEGTVIKGYPAGGATYSGGTVQYDTQGVVTFVGSGSVETVNAIVADTSNGESPNQGKAVVTVPNVYAMNEFVNAKVADAGGTQYTAGTGVTISDGTISTRRAGNITGSNIDTIISTGIPDSYAGHAIAFTTDGTTIDALAADSSEDHNFPNATLVTASALKAYVESKMASAGVAYTGTAPIVVDNGSHTIGVNPVVPSTSSDSDNIVLGTRGVVDIIDTQTAYIAVKAHANDSQKPDWFARAYHPRRVHVREGSGAADR